MVGTTSEPSGVTGTLNTSLKSPKIGHVHHVARAQRVVGAADGRVQQGPALADAAASGACGRRGTVSAAAASAGCCCAAAGAAPSTRQRHGQRARPA